MTTWRLAKVPRELSIDFIGYKLSGFYLWLTRVPKFRAGVRFFQGDTIIEFRAPSRAEAVRILRENLHTGEDILWIDSI